MKRRLIEQRYQKDKDELAKDEIRLGQATGFEGVNTVAIRSTCTENAFVDANRRLKSRIESVNQELKRHGQFPEETFIQASEPVMYIKRMDEQQP